MVIQNSDSHESSFTRRASSAYRSRVRVAAGGPPVASGSSIMCHVRTEM